MEHPEYLASYLMSEKVMIPNFVDMIVPKFSQ